MPEGQVIRRLAAILFTDLSGFTSLTQKDEQIALQLLAEAQKIQRTEFAKFGGREVKTTGDGFLAEFPSALNALHCSLAIQKQISSHNDVNPELEKIKLRIGIHLGEVVEKDGDIYGDGVNIASRIEPQSDVGGVCVSGAIKAQVQNKINATFQPIHVGSLKGLNHQIEIFKVLVPGQGDQSPSIEKVKSFRIRRTLKYLLGTMGIFALIAIVTLATRNGKGDSGKMTPIDDPSRYLSIAVLPFVNMGPDKEDEYLGDGITEELLNALAKVKGFRVPGRTSCFAFKGKSNPNIFKEIGQTLAVSTVLEGSVRTDGKRIRITAQLVNVADGYHLWSETYDRPLADILSVQNEVATKVVTELRRRSGIIDTVERIDWPTRNPSAYQLYLKARSLSERETLEDSRKAMAMYRQVLELDPDFALAYCGLADDFVAYLDDPSTWRSQVKEWVLKALELDPNLAEAHKSYAVILQCDDWKISESKLEYEKAISLNPNLVLARQSYAGFLRSQGNVEKSLRECEVAASMDPLSPVALDYLSVAQYSARQYQQAISTCDRIKKLDPSYDRIYSVLGWAKLKLGNIQEAIQAFERRYASFKNSTGLRDLACAYVVAGNKQRALSMLDKLESGTADSFVYPSELAILYGYLDQTDNAISSLRKAISMKDWNVFESVSLPTWDVLRENPKYAEILKEIRSKTLAN